MIQIPFNPENFSEEIKGIISGVDATISFDSMKSSIFKASKEVVNIIGQSAYNKICDWYKESTDNSTQIEAVNALRFAIINFAMYENLIFLTVRIANDGVFTKKNDNEVTAFKYQTNEIKESLINSAWFYMDLLISNINSLQDFFEWQSSTNKKEIDSLPIGSSDFSYYSGINSISFFYKCNFLIRKVTEEEINNRIKIDELAILSNDSVQLKAAKNKSLSFIRKAIVEKTLAVATMTFSAQELPSPIKDRLDTELTKSSSSEDFYKKELSRYFEKEYEKTIAKLDASIKNLENIMHSKNNPIVSEIVRSEDDSHIFV